MTAAVDWLPPERRALIALGPVRRVLASEVQGSRCKARPRSRDAAYVVLCGEDSEVRIKRVRASGGALDSLLRTLAERTGEPVVAAEYAGEETQGGAPVWRTVALAMTPLAKTRRNPLSQVAWRRWVNQSSRQLGLIGQRESTRLIDEAFEWLEFDWATASGSVWEGVTAGMRGVFSTPSAGFIRSQQLALSKTLETVLGRVTRSTVRLPEMVGRIGSGFNLRNPEIARAMTRHHGFWVRDQYGKRAPGLASQAQRIIASGIDRGLGRREIGRELRRELRGGLAMRGYWETVAANAVTRSRSYAMGATFRAAGVTHFRIEAVIDEQTTEICMALHEQIIPLDPAMAALDRVLSDPNPEGALWHQPFVRQRGDDMRVEFPDGTYQTIATIESPREGATPGTYSVVPGVQLAAAGVGLPPYHHRCRSTAVPEVTPLF